MSLKFPIGVNSVMPGARWTVTRKYSFSCCGCEPAAAAGAARGAAVAVVGVVGKDVDEKVAIAPRGE